MPGCHLSFHQIFKDDYVEKDDYASVKLRQLTEPEHIKLWKLLYPLYYTIIADQSLVCSTGGDVPTKVNKESIKYIKHKSMNALTSISDFDNQVTEGPI
jgi:hypothetical protein